MINMEACSKEKQRKTGSAVGTRWPEWIQAMQENSRLLREFLESSDWQPLQQAIHNREKLLRDAAEHLGLPSRNRPSFSRSEDGSDIKMALQAALDTNRELMGFLQKRRRELKSKIGEISKGRKLLNLYKTHRQAAPRFFDKFG